LFKNKKKINIIGASFFSLFLAYHLSKKKKYEITVYEKSTKLLHSFNHINIAGIKINPGFHAFEKKRSRLLLNFLNKNFGLQFTEIKKGRGLIIDKYLINETIEYNNWPSKIINFYNLKKKNINYSLKQILKNSEKKYCTYLIKNLGNKLNFNNSLQLVYPWFFPKNYTLNSNDEGSKNLNLVRNKEISNSYCFPKKYLFESLSAKIFNKLKNNKVKFKFNCDTKFIFDKKSKVMLGKKEIKGSNIICLPFFSIISNLNNNKIKIPKFKSYELFAGVIKSNYDNSLNEFTEIISSSQKLKYLKRISKIPNYGSEKEHYYQVEFLKDTKINDVNKQLKNYIKFLEYIVINKKILEKKIKFEAKGTKFIRFIFSPSDRKIKNLILKFKKFFKRQNNIIIPRFITWPINTNKQYFYSIFDEKLIKKLL